jgi:outer membrane lipoprotein carrier protein
VGFQAKPDINQNGSNANDANYERAHPRTFDNTVVIENDQSHIGEFCLPCVQAFTMNTARLGAFYNLMVTRLLWGVSFCFVLVSRPGGTGAQGAKPLDPAVVVGLVQSFYDQTKTLHAEFEQTRYTRLYDRYDRAEGKVVFKKPGMMRWDYAQPNGQVFVSNGKTLLIYQPPEEGEKNGQLIERAVDQDQLPSAFSFLIGSGNLEKDFEVRLLEHDNEKFKGGYVLQLIPRRPTPNYEQLIFYVRTLTTDGKRAGVVQRVLIIDSEGNRNRFDFSKIKFNRDVPDKRFSYRAPRGTQKVKP